MADAQVPRLRLVDAALIVTSGMIGAGIFIVSAGMARDVGGPGMLLLLWAVSGIMTILAALSYGELAAMFPHAGGQYVYLREAYNPLIAFLYGWTLFLIVQSGTIAAVAVAFAKFSGVLFPVFSEKNILFSWRVSPDFTYTISAAQLLGIFSIFVMTVINSRGIHYGKLINRVFTSTKLIALFGLLVFGVFFCANDAVWLANLTRFWDSGSYTIISSGTFQWESISGLALASAFGVALVGSLFSSDAWNNVTFIAGDIQNPKRNLPLALMIGTITVTVLYLLVNVAYLHVLPFYGDPLADTAAGRGLMFAQQDRVGTAAATMMFGGTATLWMAMLIMISTFGCNNGIVLSSVRVYQTMAKDGLFFSRMKENNAAGEPAFALWIQFFWASALCLTGKYGDLLDYVMFSVILFYILTIAGIFILRKKQPDTPRPYRAFGYPVLPALYIVLALLFCLNLLWQKPMYSYPGLILVLLGIPVYFIWSRR